MGTPISTLFASLPSAPIQNLTTLRSFVRFLTDLEQLFTQNECFALAKAVSPTKNEIAQANLFNLSSFQSLLQPDSDMDHDSLQDDLDHPQPDPTPKEIVKQQNTRAKEKSSKVLVPASDSSTGGTISPPSTTSPRPVTSLVPPAVMAKLLEPAIKRERTMFAEVLSYYNTQARDRRNLIGRTFLETVHHIMDYYVNTKRTFLQPLVWTSLHYDPYSAAPWSQFSDFESMIHEAAIFLDLLQVPFSDGALTPYLMAAYQPGCQFRQALLAFSSQSSTSTPHPHFLSWTEAFFTYFRCVYMDSGDYTNFSSDLVRRSDGSSTTLAFPTTSVNPPTIPALATHASVPLLPSCDWCASANTRCNPRFLTESVFYIACVKCTTPIKATRRTQCVLCLDSSRHSLSRCSRAAKMVKRMVFHDIIDISTAPVTSVCVPSFAAVVTSGPSHTLIDSGTGEFHLMSRHLFSSSPLVGFPIDPIVMNVRGLGQGVVKATGVVRVPEIGPFLLLDTPADQDKLCLLSLYQLLKICPTRSMTFTASGAIFFIDSVARLTSGVPQSGLYYFNLGQVFTFLQSTIFPTSNNITTYLSDTNSYSVFYGGIRYSSFADALKVVHVNMGHISKTGLLHLLKSGIFSDFPSWLTPAVVEKYFPSCEGCLLAQRRAPLPPSHRDRVPNAPGDLVEIDIHFFGKVVNANDDISTELIRVASTRNIALEKIAGVIGWLTVYDRYSHYLDIINISSMANLHALLEVQVFNEYRKQGHPIKEIAIDAQFLTGPIQALCSRQVPKTTFTRVPPDAHELIGGAESMGGYVKHKLVTAWLGMDPEAFADPRMRLQANIAIATVHNLVTMSCTPGVSAYECFHGTRLSFSNLVFVPFGAKYAAAVGKATKTQPSKTPREKVFSLYPDPLSPFGAWFFNPKTGRHVGTRQKVLIPQDSVSTPALTLNDLRSGPLRTIPPLVTDSNDCSNTPLPEFSLSGPSTAAIPLPSSTMEVIQQPHLPSPSLVTPSSTSGGAAVLPHGHATLLDLQHNTSAVSTFNQRIQAMEDQLMSLQSLLSVPPTVPTVQSLPPPAPFAQPIEIAPVNSPSLSSPAFSGGHNLRRRQISNSSRITNAIPKLARGRARRDQLKTLTFFAMSEALHSVFPFTPDAPLSYCFNVVVDSGGEVLPKSLLVPPRNLSEAKRRDDWPFWHAAVRREYDKLIANNTFNIVEQLPMGAKALRSHLVFDCKKDAVSGDPLLARARNVVDGNRQTPDTYKETYAPTALSQTHRLLMAIAASEDLELSRGDISGAFLLPDLKEDIYVSIIPEMSGLKTHVYAKLNKTLYGLKQAAHEFNVHIARILVQHGFVQSAHDPCLFRLSRGGQRYTIVSLHVDDFLFASTTKADQQAFMDLMTASFPHGVSFELDITSFNGISISRDRPKRNLCLSLPNYTANLISTYLPVGLEPVPVSARQSRYADDDDDLLPADNPLRSIVGGLIYLAAMTRPDIIWDVNDLSRHQINPTKGDLRAAFSILRFLSGTLTYGITFTKSANGITLYAYADAAYGIHPDGKSHSGICFKIGCHNTGVFHWITMKQPLITLSAAEAEFVAAVEACREIIWLRGVLSDMGFPQHGPTTLFEDNTAAISLATGTGKHPRTKHIDIRFHFLKEQVAHGTVFLEKISGILHPADGLTKRESNPKHKEFLVRALLNLDPITTSSRIFFD